MIEADGEVSTGHGQPPDVHALLDAVSRLDPTGRVAFLQALGVDDAPRAQPGVIKRADATTRAIVQLPEQTPAGPAPAHDESAEPMLGSVIGGFTITALLGRGGFAVVFRAEREVAGALQVVALKLLSYGLFSTDAQRRFRQEQTILTQLSHPNIAHLIDAGISSAGIPYIAMELINGVSITEYAARHALSLTARLRLLVDLGRAVDAAHRALIVHRDLKPSNVLVDREGQVKVLDFGIAKLLGDDTQTATLHISLTPGYAAPEQYSAGAVTTAVDVFGLGVIASELLLGTRLRADAALPTDLAEGVLLRKAWRALDPDLAILLQVALAHDPGQRYASARHVSDDIERFLRNEPITARPPSRRYRARKFISRNRVAVLTGAVFVLALLVALGLALWQARLARAQAARADSLRDFMFDAFADAEPGTPRDGPATVIEAVQRAIANSEVQTVSDTRAHLELRARLAQVLQRQGDIEGAGKLFGQTLTQATGALGKDDPLSTEIALLTTQNTMARGDYVAARAQVEALRAQLGDADGEDAIDLLMQSAVLATKVRERARALADGTQAVALARAFGNPELLRQTLNDNAVVLLSVDALPEAAAVYEEVLALNRKQFGEQHQKVANVQAGLARVYRRLGDLERAEAAARAAVTIDRAIYPGDHWNLALHLNALMLVLDAQGDYPGALAMAQEALRINRATLGEAHPETLVALYGLGAAQIRLEAYADAVPLLETALRGTEAQFGAEHWATAVRRAQLGFAQAMSGQLEVGTQALERGIADLERLADPDPDRLTAAIEKRIQLALHRQEPAQAQHWIGQLARHANDAPVSRASWPGNLHSLRGDALLQAQDALAARAELLQADALITTATNVNPTLRTRNTLLLASAEQAVGTSERALQLAQDARKQLDALRFVPQRLKELEAALPR